MLNNKGQSVIEVIVAVAIFVIIAGSSVIAILGSLSSTRLAKEETQATLYASEGIEAVESIRNQEWNNLVSGTYGVSNASGTWAFSGISDDPDGTDKFSRAVTVIDVERNDNGEIVSSGGTVDEETKQITSTINWNFTPVRQNTVTLTSYLTNWQAAKGSGGTGRPSANTCQEYCATIGYSTGTCRAASQQCTNNNEDYKPAGNQYCTGGANEDTCCCAP